MELPVTMQLEKKQYASPQEELKEFFDKRHFVNTHETWELIARLRLELTVKEMAVETGFSVEALSSWADCHTAFSQSLTKALSNCSASHFQAAVSWTDRMQWLEYANDTQVSAKQMVKLRKESLKPKKPNDTPPTEVKIKALGFKPSSEGVDKVESATDATESATNDDSESSFVDCSAFDDVAEYADVEDDEGEEPVSEPASETSPPAAFQPPPPTPPVNTQTAKAIMKSALTVHVKGLVTALYKCRDANGGEGDAFKIAYESLTQFHIAAEKMMQGEL